MLRGSSAGVVALVRNTSRQHAALQLRTEAIVQRIGQTCRGMAMTTQRHSSNSEEDGCQVAVCPQETPQTSYEGSSCDSLQWTKFHCRDGISRAHFVTNSKGGYHIGAKLGEGATAKVYRATSRREGGGSVALKVIDSELVPDEQLLQNEIEIHKATDHPNILRLLRTFKEDKYLYLVTELCEGGDLGQYMRNGDEYSILQMSEDDALQVFLQIVAAVRYLHMMGIVHRDLKPGNFLCAAWDCSGGAADKSCRRRILVKLTDFGVSASCGTKHLLTRRVGTDGYMAPEVLECKPYNEKADIFSIGCILHTLIAGSPPKRRDDGAYQLNKLRLNFASDELRSLIEWLTQVNPEARPSIEEVAATPLLQRSQTQLRESSVRITDLIDQMHNFAAFPLLKKAALIAMVSRAESDKDFLPSIEKFMSFGSHLAMNYAISATDIYESLLEEMQREMEVLMGSMMKQRGQRTGTKRGRSMRCLRPDGPTKIGIVPFKRDLRAEIDELVRQIDCNLSNNVGYSEWLAATVDASWYSDRQRLESVFKLFDVDGDGKISENDLRKAIPSTLQGIRTEAILQESQLSAEPSEGLSFETFSLLVCTDSLSTFTLQRIADGMHGPLAFDRGA